MSVVLKAASVAAGLLVAAVISAPVPAAAQASASQALSAMTCNITVRFEQAEDQAPDPDGPSVTGLVKLTSKNVKYRAHRTFSNCIGHPTIRAGSATSFVVFSGNCVSALAPTAVSINWRNASGQVVANSTASVNLTLVTTGTGANAVTTVAAAGQLTGGALGSGPLAGDVLAANQLALNCLNGQPLGNVETSGQAVLVGL